MFIVGLQVKTATLSFHFQVDLSSALVSHCLFLTIHNYSWVYFLSLGVIQFEHSMCFERCPAFANSAAKFFPTLRFSCLSSWWLPLHFQSPILPPSIYQWIVSFDPQNHLSTVWSPTDSAYWFSQPSPKPLQATQFPSSIPSFSWKCFRFLFLILFLCLWRFLSLSNLTSVFPKVCLWLLDFQTLISNPCFGFSKSHFLSDNFPTVFGGWLFGILVGGFFASAAPNRSATCWSWHYALLTTVITGLWFPTRAILGFGFRYLIGHSSFIHYSGGFGGSWNETPHYCFVLFLF